MVSLFGCFFCVVIVSVVLWVRGRFAYLPPMPVLSLVGVGPGLGAGWFRDLSLVLRVLVVGVVIPREGRFSYLPPVPVFLLVRVSGGTGSLRHYAVSPASSCSSLS